MARRCGPERMEFIVSDSSTAVSIFDPASDRAARLTRDIALPSNANASVGLVPLLLDKPGQLGERDALGAQSIDLRRTVRITQRHGADETFVRLE